MGAHGALQLAFNHPNVFRGAGAHSPSLHTSETLISIAGTDEEFASRDPISLAAEAPDIELVNIWIDIGEDDPWLERVDLLHQALEERGVNHDWSVRPGDHDGEYWERNLVDYLSFYDSVLNWRDGS
jgi:S-formylglutathione hydrolase FrmB